MEPHFEMYAEELAFCFVKMNQSNAVVCAAMAQSFWYGNVWWGLCSSGVPGNRCSCTICDEAKKEGVVDVWECPQHVAGT